MIYKYLFPKHQREKIQNIKQNKSVKSLEEVLIEPIIAHMKSDHRLSRNYLKGFIGDEINLAVSAFNLKKWTDNYLRLLFWTDFYYLVLFYTQQKIKRSINMLIFI